VAAVVMTFLQGSIHLSAHTHSKVSRHHNRYFFISGSIVTANSRNTPDNYTNSVK